MSLPLHVIAPQHPLIAQEEVAVGDDRIGPRLGLAAVGLARRIEASLFAVAVRRRFDEGGLAVLAVHVETAVGIADRAGADARVLPLLLASGELDTHQA